MKIFVNAVALKVAGGKAVLSNFLEVVSGNSFNHEYHIFIPDAPEYEKYKSVKHFRVHTIPKWLNKFYFRYYIDHIYLISEIKKIKPAVIFSMGNVALPVKHIPQVVIFHMSHIIYPESAYWERVGVSKLFFSLVQRQILKKFNYANVIAAQTKAAEARLERLFSLGNKTVIVPNAVSLVESVACHDNSLPAAFEKIKNREHGSAVFLCLSRYYGHKNIEILVEVAKLIKARKSSHKIVITIEPQQGKGARHILEEIEEKRLGDILINVGNVPMKYIPDLYNLSDALLLPTLLESFSGTYVEAAFYKKPIFTSDYDFATQILGPDAVYFDPLNALDIANQLDVIKDSAYIAKIKEEAYQRITQFPSWEEVTKMYINLLENTSKQAYV